LAAGASGKKLNPHSVTGALATVWERRWLAWFYIQRQVSQEHSRSFLGPIWLLLGPLMMVALYTLIFSEMIGLRFRQIDSVSNYGLYLYCGLIPFLVYAGTTNKSVGIIRGNSSLVQKVIFPMEILPLSTVATALVGQIFGFGALTVLIAILPDELHWTALLFPILMVPQLLFTLGLGYLGAVAGTYLPDLQEALRAVVRASFFASPIIWPPERVPEHLSFLVEYNPLAYLAINYRHLFLEGIIPDPVGFVKFTVFALLLCAAGLIIFVKFKKKFPDLL
jgi:ABC-type polysaccharide/polyol phosphate export permease